MSTVSEFIYLPARVLCVALAFGVALAGIPVAHAGSAAAPTILVMGDSLSAGYGIEVEQGWVALLAQRLTEQGYGYRVVNASVSGETTRGAASRLPRALALHKPAIVIIELGGNDGLRGLPLAVSRANLESMVQQARKAGARVLLVGMKIPPNYGPRYSRDFEAVFTELAAQYKLPFVPFFLDFVALDAARMQADGIHPNAAAQPFLLDNLWPTLKPLLKKGPKWTSTG
ncbi:MAG TPA: arylesterase [Steroidobacteraceae bacterium]|nr:arylesterase [Steroidobacteraceae bacterium]